MLFLSFVWISIPQPEAATTDAGKGFDSWTYLYRASKSTGSMNLIPSSSPPSTLTIKADQTQVYPGAKVQITGTLTDSSGKPISGATVTAYQDVGTYDQAMKSSTTDSNGNYLIVCYGTWYFGKWGCGSFTWYTKSSNGLQSSNVTITVAPTPTPIPTGGASEYTGVVYQTFTTSSYSVEAINGALASCPTGQAVKLAAGDYVINGIINVPAGKTLVGCTDGSGGIGTKISTTLLDSSLKANGYINIGSGGNCVRNIKTLNGYYFFGSNSHDFLIQDCEYNGPTDSAAGQFNLCGFLIYLASNGNYDNGRFIGCKAKDAPGFGFLVSADSAKNSNRLGPNAYSAHNWEWTDCEAYDCGVANIEFPDQFVYGCGFDFFEGFGPNDDVVGLRVNNCVANGNAADGFHIEYMMDILDCEFKDCTANDNGQWFKKGRTSNPHDGVLIGTGFYLGGSQVSQTKVLNSKADDNWGYSNRGGGHGIVDSQMDSDLGGVFGQNKKESSWKS
jgi:hypothetical protein